MRNDEGLTRVAEALVVLWAVEIGDAARIVHLDSQEAAGVEVREIAQAARGVEGGDVGDEVGRDGQRMIELVGERRRSIGGGLLGSGLGLGRRQRMARREALPVAAGQLAQGGLDVAGGHDAAPLRLEIGVVHRRRRLARQAAGGGGQLAVGEGAERLPDQ